MDPPVARIAAHHGAVCLVVVIHLQTNRAEVTTTIVAGYTHTYVHAYT